MATVARDLPIKLLPINWGKVLMLGIRAMFLILLVYTFDAIVEFGTSPLLISGWGLCGIVVGNYLSNTRLNAKGLVVFSILLTLLYQGFFYLADLILPVSDKHTFWIFLVEQHLNTALFTFYLGLVSTWAFLRYRHVLTAEILVLGGICVYLLSGHRNYQLDSPASINSLAWTLGLSPQSLLIVCGSLGLVALLIYTIASNVSAVRARFSSLEHINVYESKASVLGAVLAFLLLVLLVAAVSRSVYLGYDLDKGLIANGVGQGVDEGATPLGFHSALGGSAQPAALVRLEGDYSTNPHLPMLYLREGALSQYRDNALVVAKSPLNRDVSNTSPHEHFVGVKDEELVNRESVVQSIYVIAKQKAAFAIDYPIAIRLLKNPDPGRFKSSYRAYSLAPTTDLKSLTYESVGDPRWSKEVEAHYLEPHPDSRYAELALEVTQDYPAPIEKALALTTYLNKNATYTLSPKHEVGADEDPTAAFLFGDLRGYCVHFAHAVVYMLRSLGVPSRIATGYLTDLSQAKDGHILLRMSDRHAWPEIYVTSQGWIPFDVEPEKVETHADTNVDMNLLEELMSVLDPGEEILPEETLEGENNVYPLAKLPIPTAKDFLTVATIVLCLLLIIKLYLRYGWKLALTPRSRLTRSYVSLYSFLLDLGYPRLSGETRQEYCTRIAKALKCDPLRIGQVLTTANFSKPNQWNLAVAEIDTLRAEGLRSAAKLSRWKRALAFLNPISILSSRRRW